MLFVGMPELPEVETVVRGLRAAGVEGARIRGVAIHWPRTVAGLKPEAFMQAVCGRTIQRIGRRAKYIVMTLDNGQHLLVHLRMTGQFHIDAPRTPPDGHDRVVLTLADGRRLGFHDTRKFGRFQLARQPQDVLGHLGPEPLEAAFTPAVLRARLAGRHRSLKPLLLDQSCLAGLGNIYVDEALWQARLHPLRTADSLTRPESERLHAVIQSVLTQAVAAGGSTLGDGAANFYSVAGRRGRHADALQVFRRTGEPCPRCGEPIVRMVVGQRGTHLCMRCQRRLKAKG